MWESEIKTLPVTASADDDMQEDGVELDSDAEDDEEGEGDDEEEVEDDSEDENA